MLVSHYLVQKDVIWDTGFVLLPYQTFFCSCSYEQPVFFNCVSFWEVFIFCEYKLLPPTGTDVLPFQSNIPHWQSQPPCMGCDPDKRRSYDRRKSHRHTILYSNLHCSAFSGLCCFCYYFLFLYEYRLLPLPDVSCLDTEHMCMSSISCCICRRCNSCSVLVV